MNRAEYEAIPADNFSRAKHVLRSPAHYIAERDKPRTAEDELKFAVGTLVHAMTLEGKNLLDLYAIKPEGMSFATTEGKAWRARQTLPILAEASAVKIPKMAEAIANDPDAARILELCPEREHALVANRLGMPCKALLDALGKDDDGFRMFADIKTTTDARPWEFQKKVRKLHYDMQIDWYAGLLALVEGLDYRPRSAWIVCEDKEPFEVRCYYPSDRIITRGGLKVERALKRLKECREAGEWPKFTAGFQELDYPDYVGAELEEAA